MTRERFHRITELLWRVSFLVYVISQAFFDHEVLVALRNLTRALRMLEGMGK